jgi:hypothetical protein
MAGAAVALVLAVVVVGDLGRGGNGSDEGAGGAAFDDRSMQLESASEADAGDDGEEAPATAPSAADRENIKRSEAPDEASAFGANLEPCPVESAGGGTGAGDAGGPATAPAPPAEPAPSPAPEEPASADCVPAAANQAQASAAEDLADELREGAAEGGGADEKAAPSAADDQGVSMTTVVEIVLGGALVALVLGIVAEAALRRRRAA